jgi:hypothetical protein
MTWSIKTTLGLQCTSWVLTSNTQVSRIPHAPSRSFQWCAGCAASYTLALAPHYWPPRTPCCLPCPLPHWLPAHLPQHLPLDLLVQLQPTGPAIYELARAPKSHSHETSTKWARFPHMSHGGHLLPNVITAGSCDSSELGGQDNDVHEVRRPTTMI